MSKAFISQKRLNLVAIAIIFAFLVILVRLFYLHVWNQGKLTQIIERNRQNFEITSACRGNIGDCRGNLLASTQSTITLGLDPVSMVPGDEHKYKALGQLIGREASEIKELAEQKFKKVAGAGEPEVRSIRWKKLAEGLSDATYEKVLALGIKGVYGNRQYARTYPGGSLAAHVIGFLNKEGTAVGGVEQFMDFYLKGQDGWCESEKDGKRRELVQFRAREVGVVDGDHVELSLDLVVQHAIEAEIERIVEEMDPLSVSIIVSEPATGYILGLANYPTYDPNEFWKYDIDSHRNRAVTDVYEPGSPFKIVTASAAINESLVSLDDSYDCSINKVEYQGRVVKLPKDHKPFNELTVRDIVKQSSNRGVAQIAMLLGDQKLYDYAKAFGFGEIAGYGPGGEVRGTLHPVEKWDGLTIGRMPMGHALSGTALQVHYAMSVAANGGVLMQPQIVKAIYDDKHQLVTHFPPKSKRRVISPETAEVVAKLLAEVVGPEGTSRRASITGFNVAGKSGTSQKIINGRYSDKHHVGSFSGFFPADNPRVLITVVIDEAKIGKVAYGGVVAAPSFKNIGENLIQYLCIQPNDSSRGLLASKMRKF